MGQFDSIWTTYGLRANPFFTEPLEIESGLITVENLVGRQAEKEEVTNLIRMGGGTRFLVIGEAGVGKTSLINYVRYKARNEGFISPLKEISVPKNASAKQVMVDTLVLLYDEIRRIEIKIAEDVKKKLEWLQPFADLENFEGEGSVWDSSTAAKLVELFKQTSKELKELGYPSIILHYNNLDKIKDGEVLLDFFHDFRDFLQNQNTIFIFIGDDLLHHVVASTQRLSQVFQMSSVDVGKLTEEEVKEIIEVRIEILRFRKDKKINLIGEEVISMLYILFEGNIRDILNSLSFSFQNIEQRNVAKTLTISKIKGILYKAVHDRYLNKLSETEKDILKVIMIFGKITPTELAKQTKKNLQNISSYYLKKLTSAKSIEVVEIRGRQKFYAVVPQIKWWKLEKTKQEMQMDEEEKKLLKDEMERYFQTTLGDFKLKF